MRYGVCFVQSQVKLADIRVQYFHSYSGSTLHEEQITQSKKSLSTSMNSATLALQELVSSTSASYIRVH